MNYKHLVELLQTMLSNVVPTKQIINEPVSNVINFWGSDSTSSIINEEDGTRINIVPDEASGPSFSLIKEGVKAHDEFLKEVSTDPKIGKNIGRSTLEKSLERLLRKNRETQDLSEAKIKESIKAEVEALANSIIDWTATAPIDFLILEDFDEITVGNVTFSRVKSVIENLIQEFNARIDINESPAEHKDGQKKQITDAFQMIFDKTATCAEVSVVAESSRVWQTTEEEIDTALNLLRCYTHVLFARELKVKMGLRHETGYYMRPNIGFSTTDPSWVIDARSIGVLQPFRLTNANLTFLRKNMAFDELSNVLRKPDRERTKLEKLIVTTIRWLGRGIIENDNANKVLHFAAASENLIMGGKTEGEITDKFSRRLAFLVAKDGTERYNLFIKVRDLYKKRSKVIHTGSTNIESSDVSSMEIITLKALVEMAKRLKTWKSHDDFLNWFEQQNFGAEPIDKS